MTSSQQLTLVSRIALLALLTACDYDSTDNPPQSAATVQAFGGPVVPVGPGVSRPLLPTCCGRQAWSPELTIRSSNHAHVWWRWGR